MKLVVTGGRGFIGSHFVEMVLKKGWEVYDIDKLGYASHKELPWDKNPLYTFVNEDISQIKHLPTCDVIVNFAAESHVDNSIKSPDEFLKSNVVGVHNLLELIRGMPKYDRPLFFQISTDEVYGDNLYSKFYESDKLTPSNPYSATKAAAEMLVLAAHRTFGIDYIITRSSNNYGPRQFEEKLIPRCMTDIKNKKKIPIHGDGSYIRDWTYVKDNCEAIIMLIECNCKNDVYNIAAENYLTNMEVVNTVLDWHNISEKDKKKYYKFVENRWGQDLRYAVSSDKIRNLGWVPVHEKGLYKWF